MCPEGQECLANRCVPAGGEPVPSDSQRLVAEPEALAVIGRAESRPDELPSVVTFGGTDSSTLLLAFPPIWRGARRIEAAFLLLEPMPGTFGSGADVPVHVWRVRGRWKPETLKPNQLPDFVPPASRGLARSSVDSPLRIDVTDLVTYLATHPSADHGIAVRAGTSDGAGVSFATGSSGGKSPRLEVYAR